VYQSATSTLLSLLSTFGIVSQYGEESVQASHARQSLSEAEAALSKAKTESNTAQHDLSDLFNLEGFGKYGQWKKLQGTCLKKDTGE
jgi:protein kinase C substrate 80K-H